MAGIGGEKYFAGLVSGDFFDKLFFQYFSGLGQYFFRVERLVSGSPGNEKGCPLFS